MSRPSLASPALVLAAALSAAPAAAQRQTAPIDTSCSACQDFFKYANGGWIERTQIPGDQPGWSSFHELQEHNFTALRVVLDEEAKGGGKLGTFYATCMDSAAVERAGLKPIAEDLGQITAARSPADVQRQLARLHRHQVAAGFTLYSTPDAKRSGRTIAEIYQAGLGLPEREYYLKPDSASASLRAQYVDHVARMLRLAGDDSTAAARAAGRVMALETALAQASMPLEQQRDPEAVYHLMSLAALKPAAPRFGWDAYFKELGVTAPAEINVAQPGFLRAVDSLVSAVPVEDWRAYLRWQLLAAAAPSLPTGFVNESFRFNGTVLQGIAQPKPRWKRCLQLTDNMMGDLLGEAYVRKHFSPEAKARALEMVRNIQAEFRQRLSALSWMSESTKAKAYRKLDAIVNRIGYPDKWIDYSAVEVKREPFAANVKRATRFAARRDLAKVGKPTDRTEWGMTPPTVNASYNPSLNVITFPAGILQPPFFDPG
jgi:predicted metalloendopeptidase